MSYHSQDFDEAPQEMAEIEVILVNRLPHSFAVKLDEDSEIIRIPRAGVKLKAQPNGYALLTLSEQRAITYNLV